MSAQMTRLPPPSLGPDTGFDLGLPGESLKPSAGLPLYSSLMPSSRAAFIRWPGHSAVAPSSSWALSRAAFSSWVERLHAETRGGSRILGAGPSALVQKAQESKP